MDEARTPTPFLFTLQNTNHDPDSDEPSRTHQSAKPITTSARVRSTTISLLSPDKMDLAQHVKSSRKRQRGSSRQPQSAADVESSGCSGSRPRIGNPNGTSVSSRGSNPKAYTVFTSKQWRPDLIADLLTMTGLRDLSPEESKMQ